MTTADMSLALLGILVAMVGAVLAGLGIGSVYSGWLFRIFWIVVGTLIAVGGIVLLAIYS